MKTRSGILYSEVYARFYAIENGDYYRKIRFVQKHRNRLGALELDEYLEILQAYREALFQTGKYREHINAANELVSLSIQYNVTEFNGEDLFFDTLLQQAASHYNLEEFESARYILKELVKISPDHESVRLFLMRSYINEEKELRTMTLRGISVLCFLLLAALVAADLLVLKPFFETYSAAGTLGYQGFFISGVLLLAYDQISYRYRGVSRAWERISESKASKTQASKDGRH